MHIDEIISVTSGYIEQDLNSDAPIFESASLNKNSAMDLVGKAKSAKEIFQAIKMPQVEDCLDML